tara:strand:+ start:2629 stop:3132 length:504 start_codon:yes stop_codon:yes gene_type:complete
MGLRSDIEIDESWYIKPDGIKERFSCGGVVCRVDDAGQIWVLLTHEKDNRHFVLPKGGREAGEKDLDTAGREVLEETGIHDLSMITDLGWSRRLSFKKHIWSNTHFFLFYTQQLIGSPTDDEHFHDPAWFDLKDDRPYFWPDQRRLIQDNRIKINDLVRAHHNKLKL